MGFKLHTHTLISYSHVNYEYNIVSGMYNKPIESGFFFTIVAK